MSNIVIILLVIGIAYLVLFRKPGNPSDTEIVNWFSSRLSEIAANLDHDIASDHKGEYPHAGKQEFEKRGNITYVLHDKSHARFDVSDRSKLGLQDIRETDGYIKLDNKVRNLNLSLVLEEKAVEGDGVDTFNELDEYVDDYPRYYTVTISGW